MTPVKATRGRLVTTELAAAGRSGRAERPDGAAGPRGQTGGVDDGLRAWVLHVDLDQFIPAVEVLRRPDLAGVPVIVGGRGDPTERAVVSTASYEARAFGVGSGMPLRLAARKAPTAVILPVDAAAYEAASAQVMGVLRGLDGAAVQVLGWDEAFVGVRTGDPEGSPAAHRPRCWRPPGCTARWGSATPKSGRRSATRTVLPSTLGGRSPPRRGR